MGATFKMVTCNTWIISLFLSFLFCCSPEYAGGVETTNGLTVAVKENQIRGTAPVGSQIVLCDTSYAFYTSFQLLVELFIDTTYADESGAFAFESVPDGSYNLIGRSAASDSGTIIQNIGIHHLNTTELHKSSQYLPVCSVTGTVYIGSQSTSFAVICIMGTDLRDTADSQGVYFIRNVPPGIHSITGSYIKMPKPGERDVYMSTIKQDIVSESNRTVQVDLNLQKIN
jgi:hypothetical protein